jgi:hypothetical protein
MNYIKRYWKQITGIAVALSTVFGWLWEMKTRVDADLNVQNQLVADVRSLKAEIAEHDQDLDDQDHRIIPLEKTEELREKGLMR